MAPIPRLRAYEGPAFMSYGFRPLFLLAALQAGLTILVWLSFVTGLLSLPTAFTPVDWHIHQMLFGYQAAAIGGFLLTAIPNWTGRLPLQGRPLLVLVGAWIAGRIAVTASAWIGWRLAMVVDGAFLALLAAAALREIVAGRNWRNLTVVALVCLMLAANLSFHVEAAVTGTADYGRRLAIAVILLLVALIGGRIIPSFTRNWLARREPGRMPIAFDSYDKVTLVVTAAALLAWILWPYEAATGILLTICAGFHALRLWRWAGERTWRNPLLLILHVAYAFVPAGLILSGLASFGLIAPAAGLHAWTAGAMGTLTLAVMSRASLGHTGRALVATPATQVMYVLVVVGALARVCSAFGHAPVPLLHVAGLAWSVGFLGFAVIYWPVLTAPRQS
jgi:uncharacterized protein involved in response to NO